LTQAGTSTVGFGIGGLTATTNLGVATNQINVTGLASTVANSIIGPWATVGTTAALQTDYAVNNINAGTVNALGIQGANIAGVANDTTFTAAHATTSNYTVTAGYTASGTAKNINTLRYLGAAGTITMTGAQTLGTFGVLNSSTSTGSLTIGNTAATGTLTLPTTAAGNLYLTTGGAQGITVNANITNNTAPGVLSLVVSGNNIVTLAGTNTYTGGTVINSGTLTIAGTSQLGNVAGDVTFNNSGTLSITAASQTLANGRDFVLNNGAVATLNTTNA
jgi:autotransporter-associated beta strand protein